MAENTSNAVTTVYHIVDGPVVMYNIDARDAIARCPNEYAAKPWTDKARQAFIDKQAKRD